MLTDQVAKLENLLLIKNREVKENIEMSDIQGEIEKYEDIETKAI